MTEPLRAVGGRRELQEALDREQLAVHFQPIVEIHTGLVRGAEALLRWDHPQHGLLAAASFLPAIEDSPLMPQVTAFVLSASCRAVAETAPAGWIASVNITASDASSEATVVAVQAALEESGLAPERLTVEVTETGLLGNHRDCARVVGRLQELGVGIALDDFGTGYSSLSLLRELPITELKIDKTFVDEVDTSPADAAIVGNVVRLAAAFGASVVAEGVERSGQAAFLDQLGCGYAQGYLWSRPAPLEQVIDVVPQPRQRRRDLRSPDVVVERVERMLAEGASPHTIAAALNADNVRTPEGKRWHSRSVGVLVRRIQSARPSQ